MGEEQVQPPIPDLPEDIIGPGAVISIVKLALIVLVVLGAVAGMVGMLAAIRRKGRVEAAVDPVEAARIEIARVYARLPQLSAKEVAVELPRIIKGYLRGKYGVNLTSATTSELWRDRKQWQNKVPAGFGEYLAQFLDQCDAVKFDSTSLTEETKRQLFEAALFGDLTPDESWSLEHYARKAPVPQP